MVYENFFLERNITIWVINFSLGGEHHIDFHSFRGHSAYYLVLETSSASYASEASQAINNFAFNAGKIIMGNSGINFFFSPYSIISSFGMIYAGAKGDTAREIELALGVSSDIHRSIGDLVRDLKNRAIFHLQIESGSRMV